jgi:hypothetical protein
MNDTGTFSSRDDEWISNQQFRSSFFQQRYQKTIRPRIKARCYFYNWISSLSQPPNAIYHRVHSTTVWDPKRDRAFLTKQKLCSCFFGSSESESRETKRFLSPGCCQSIIQWLWEDQTSNFLAAGGDGGCVPQLTSSVLQSASNTSISFVTGPKAFITCEWVAAPMFFKFVTSGYGARGITVMLRGLGQIKRCTGSRTVVFILRLKCFILEIRLHWTCQGHGLNFPGYPTNWTIQFYNEWSFIRPKSNWSYK